MEMSFSYLCAEGSRSCADCSNVFPITANISGEKPSTRLTRIFRGLSFWLNLLDAGYFETGRNYARDQKFQMDALFNPCDQSPDRIAVRTGFVTNACASAK